MLIRGNEKPHWRLLKLNAETEGVITVSSAIIQKSPAASAFDKEAAVNKHRNPMRT